MREMSLEYQRAQLAIQGRIAELRAEGKQQTAPEAAERLQVRIKDLAPLLRKAREQAALTIDYQNIFRRIREKHAKKFGPVPPENMTPHTMRHTFCTKMALAGMNPKSLQHIMGHKNNDITMNYYAHSDPAVAMDDLRRVQTGPASAA